MKENIKSYVILGVIILSIISVSLTHNYFNAPMEVEKIDDILLIQNNLEEQYLADLRVNNYRVDNPKVVLNPYEISPLTALIMFNTEEPKEVSIEIVGKDELTTIKHTFEKNTEHILPIYGLYPDYENIVIITINDISNEVIIKTEKLPADFVLPTNVIVDREKVSDELIFLTIAARGYNVAFDRNGDPRWYLTKSYSWDIKRLANGRIMFGSNRPIAPPYHTVGLVEMDLSGKIYREYVMPGGYHHDFFEMEDGNLLVASNNFHLGTVEDYIILIDRDTGSVIEEWDLNKVLPKEDGKAEMWVDYDWFHNNSVWYDDVNNAIILSGRHQDAVISINFDTKELNWIIGDKTNWGEEIQKYFFTPIGENFEWQWAQHSAMSLPNGNIFLLDNGNNRSKIEEKYFPASHNYTRGVIYEINTDNMTIKQIWQYGKERGSSFYSPYISNIDYFKDSHYLIHSGGISEVDGEPLNIPGVLNDEAKLRSVTIELLNDELIFELDVPTNYYRAKKMNLYSENNLQFKKGERLGTLGMTSTINEKNNLFFASTNIPAEYELHLRKEVDRFIFSAKLIEGERVRIILVGSNKRRTYGFTATSRAYTAMCINIFDEYDFDEEADQINVNSYINSEGLSGKYHIYIKIGDKIYNTNQYANFD